MDSKYLGSEVEQYLEAAERDCSYNDISSLSAIPISKTLIISPTFTVSSFSLQSKMKEGEEIHIVIPKGVVTETLTQPLPNGSVTNEDSSVITVLSNVDEININPGTTTEINIITTDTLSYFLIAVTY